jgi:hypothetical protein
MFSSALPKYLKMYHNASSFFACITSYLTLKIPVEVTVSLNTLRRNRTINTYKYFDQMLKEHPVPWSQPINQLLTAHTVTQITGKTVDWLHYQVSSDPCLKF